MNNTTLYKKGLALLCSVIMGISGYSLAKGESSNEKFNRGDSIVTTKNVNMRLGTSTDTFKLGEVPKGSTCDRILSLNGFDLVRYDDRIIFLSDDFTSSDVPDYNSEYYYVEEDKDIIRTTTKVNFRLGPSTNEKQIRLLNKGDQLTVIAKSTSYSDPEDVWYLAKYHDEIGFVKAEYTTSLKSTIQEMDPSITDVEVESIGYVESDSYLYNSQGSPVDVIGEYQTVSILGNKDNNYIVEYNGTVGLVPMDSVKTFDGTFVVVDLSDQKIWLYCDTDIVFESACTTGYDKRRTDVGSFTVYERKDSRYFTEDHQARYMWANFDHGNGIHDAPWEPEEKFGSEKYRKHNGSKGCVRLPDDAALFLRKHIKKGTKVLVKQ